MDAVLEALKNRFGKDDDFFMQRSILGDVPVVLLGFFSLIDVNHTKIILQEQMEHAVGGSAKEKLENRVGELEERGLDEIIVYLIQGKLIVYLEEERLSIVKNPTPLGLERSVNTPNNENVLQGPLNAFNENLTTNIGIVRKEIATDNVRVKYFISRSDLQRRFALLYAEGQADPRMVERILARIENNLDKEVNNLQHLAKMLGLSWIGFISKFNTTELPFEASCSLKKGRILIFLDRLPFALVLPNLFWDMFLLENDRNYPLPIMLAIRTTRILGVLLTVIFPGLYVALVSVNPEVLRIELALSIAQSRSGVPYPAIIEMILMLIVLELILEASVRLPSSVGPTITMVGGIILGQAVVQAKLVSNLLIIILAATTIANSTVIGFQNSLSIRFFKYLIVILAAIFGVVGILGGMVIISAYLASLTTFGMPYLHVTRNKGDYSNG